jgi:hypothetical protein
MPLAARLTDQTTHGTPLMPGPGSVNVLIGSLFAWRTMLDQHVCPAVSISGADGVGSVLMGSPTVWINSQMACRQMDIVIEKPGLAMGPVNPIMMGCPTVEIGGPVAAVAIAAGVMTVAFGGMNVSGSPPDVTAFLGMTAQAAGASRAAGLHLATVFGDSAHPITVIVGRSQPGVLGDSFASNEVDLDDLEQFSATPRSAHPGESGRDEVITHFMVERHDAAANGNNFNAAHQAGIDAQNEMRAERGQSPITSQVMTNDKDADGNSIARFNHADGSHQDLHLDNNSNIVRNDPP